MRLIDADALMVTIREHDYPLKAHYNSTDNGMFTLGIQQAVDESPTIEPPQGEWIPSPNIMECVVCSRCNSDNLSAQVVDPPPPWYHFCPNCGAKMKGGEA